MKTAAFKYFLAALLLGITWIPAFSQNFIGKNPAEIAAMVKSDYPQFKIDRNAVNHTYRYLKYVDKISEQTILFFLSEKDICTYVRWMSDYSNLNEMTGMLNKKYKKTGENTWSYSDRGENYTIKMKEEEWYFTITFRKI